MAIEVDRFCGSGSPTQEEEREKRKGKKWIVVDQVAKLKNEAVNIVSYTFSKNT